MALRTYNPITPGLRQLVLVDRSQLWKGKPVKALTEGRAEPAGRNAHGHITARRRGGGHKRTHCRFGPFQARRPLSGEAFAPCRPRPSRENTYDSSLFRIIQIPPGPQSKPGPANPSPAKLIQIKTLGFTWLYSSESGLINGLQPIPNKNFSPCLSPCRQAPRTARLRF